MEDLSYRNRGLQTDYYELTMAQAYYDAGTIKDLATFELFFRSPPFDGGYAIACGIYDAIKFLSHYGFTDSDINYLKAQDHFSEDFLDYLTTTTFEGEAWGVPEGTIVFPYEPVLQITGPLGILQLVESGLLNIINYQTLIATKAARISYATKRTDTVLEFGLRRAQGDGHLPGSRAAIIGGCVSTSNTLAGKIYDLPVAGTQAHSWIQSFDTEIEAFRKFADSFPNNTILLVDTYNTLESGIPNAIQVAKEMADKGQQLRGIRIDSGDLAWFSIRAAKLLDEAGFPDVKIILSSDLDEYIIESIVNQILNSRENGDEFDFRERLLDRLLWGVGTKLITGSGDDKAALGGVYKLVEINQEPVIKISENRAKTTNPGRKNLWRLQSENGTWIADVMGLYNENQPVQGDRIYHPSDPTKFIDIEECSVTPLHVNLMEKYLDTGATEKEVWQESRQYCQQQLYDGIDKSHLRFLNPHIYKVSLTRKLFELKQKFLRKHSHQV